MTYNRRAFVTALVALGGCSTNSNEMITPSEHSSRLNRTGKWPFVRHDIKNTAYLSHIESISEPKFCWTTSFESKETRYESPSVITESHLLLSNYGHKSAEAVNPHDGSHLWSLKLPGRPEHSPCIVGDMSVIPAGSYLVICELSNGDIHHSLELSGVTGPPIVDHNTVFVGTSAGNPKAYAIDLLSGNIIWKHSTNVITTPPSITGSIVVYTDWSGKVYSINVSDGSVRWEFSTKGEFIRSAPVIKSGIVYVCAGTNRTESWVYAFDVEDGEKRWQKHLTDASISASPAADSSKLYVVDDKSRVHALDLITGERQWKTRGRRNAVPRQTVDQSPVVTDSHLYYVTGNQSIMAVSTASGDRHWRKEIQLDVQTSPSLTPEGVILTGAKDIISLCSRSDH